MSSIDLLSYNLNFHTAYPELVGLAKTYNADILCLQECYVDDLADNIANLKLAAKTTTGKLGLAVYCNHARFKVRSSTSIPICLSVYEKLYPEERERLLIVELFDNINQQSLFVASFHATHLVASNHLRRQQLAAALKALNTLHKGSPVVLAGDFNYPFFQAKLKRTAREFNYNLLTPSDPTFNGRRFSGRFDMAATTHANTHIQTLPFGISDHAPILVHLGEPSISAA